MRWKSTDKKFYYYSSSERFKENIRTLEDEGIDPDIIYHLTPRIFDEKLDENRGTDEGNIVGFVAEEVEKACPDIIMYNENGEVMMYSTDAVQALTVGALQKLRDRVEALESQLKIQPKALPGMGVRMKSGQGMYIKADRREGGTGVEQQDGRTV